MNTRWTGILALAVSVNAFAADGIDNLIADGKTSLSFRYRFEGVDDDAFDLKAKASTWAPAVAALKAERDELARDLADTKARLASAGAAAAATGKAFWQKLAAMAEARDRLKTELAARDRQAERLQGALDAAMARARSREQEVAERTAALLALTAERDLLVTERAALRADNARAAVDRTRRNGAERDSLAARRALRQELAMLAGERDRLARKLSAAETKIDALNRTGTSSGATDRTQRPEVASNRDAPPANDASKRAWQLVGLLLRAEAQRAANRLTRPVGDNAVETYRQVLALSPGHADAAAGIAAIKRRYTRLAAAARAKGLWRDAVAYYNAALEIDPDDRKIARALREIERQAGEDLDRRAAEDEDFAREGGPT